MFSSTVLITILGSVGGTLTRLLPELIKIVNKYIDNKHELKMLEKSNEIERIRIESKLEAFESTGTYTDPVADYMSYNVLTAPSKSKKIDIVNALVRPYTTYILLTLYCGIKIAFFILNPLAGLSVLWGPEDMAMLSGILSFWFLGRVLDKR